MLVSKFLVETEKKQLKEIERLQRELSRCLAKLSVFAAATKNRISAFEKFAKEESLIQRSGGYQPNKGQLDPVNPPKGGSGVN